MNIKIVTLKEFPTYIETIAQIASEEFNLTKEFYMSNFKKVNTFLALHYGSLAGFVCIDKNDLDKGKYAQINNWLADLYVLKSFRRKGVASKLVDYVLQEKNKNPLFLWTKHKKLLSFFKNKGFKLKNTL